MIKGRDEQTQKNFPVISASNILNLIENILNGKVSALTKQMAMNCLAKIFAIIRGSEDRLRIKKIIEEQKSSPNYEA